jgi:thioredoxin reductase (NADPH)
MASRVLEHSKIDVLWNTVITGYEGTDFLSAIKVLTNGETERTIPCGGLFMAIGHDPNTLFLAGSNVNVTSGGYVDVHNHVFTSVEGLFAAGDVHDQHYRQAVSYENKSFVFWFFYCFSKRCCWIWLHQCDCVRAVA